MLLRSKTVTAEEFQTGTGWEIRPEGACKGEVCVPLPDAVRGDPMELAALADAMGMPLAEEPAAGLWALGPESIGSRALTTAQAPELELPDVNGKVFDLASLRGQKVVVFAWAPY